MNENWSRPQGASASKLFDSPSLKFKATNILAQFVNIPNLGVGKLRISILHSIRTTDSFQPVQNDQANRGRQTGNWVNMLTITPNFFAKLSTDQIWNPTFCQGYQFFQSWNSDFLTLGMFSGHIDPEFAEEALNGRNLNYHTAKLRGNQNANSNFQKTFLCHDKTLT